MSVGCFFDRRSKSLEQPPKNLFALRQVPPPPPGGIVEGRAGGPTVETSAGSVIQIVDGGLHCQVPTKAIECVS
jgi:hypothetical protein